MLLMLMMMIKGYDVAKYQTRKAHLARRQPVLLIAYDNDDNDDNGDDDNYDKSKHQTRKAHLARRQPGKKSTRGSTTCLKNQCDGDINDRRNSGGTLRQKLNQIDIWTNGPMDQWTNGPMDQWTNGITD